MHSFELINSKGLCMKKNKVVEKKRTRLSKEEWLRHVEDWNASEQSWRNYCAEHEVAENTLRMQAYRQRYRTQQIQEPHTQTRNHHQSSVPSNFVPIKISPTVAHEAYEVRFPSGVLIKIPGQESLSSLLKSLEQYL